MTDQPMLGGRYEVGDLIGRGGMAEVHVGTDTRLGRQVAIKLLRSDLARDPSFLIRFRREAQSSAGLNHPSIVAVYDSGEDDHVESGGAVIKVPYIVMEYVRGRTLREVLNEHGPLDPFEATRVTEGVLDALSYSHRAGIVHRDIKPANVMLGDDGAVKVMDFGIARALADSNATMTQTQVVIGTAQYLSPEQAHGQPVDERTDLYSVGCMLFELLTGRPPFVGDTPVSIAYQQVGKAPEAPSTINPNVWPDLDAVVLHALNKDRNDRYQDAESFRADLHATRMGQPVSAAARDTAAGLLPAPVAPLSEPTEVLSGLPAEPTEVYAAPAPPEPPLVRTWDTATMDPIAARQERRSGFAYVVLTLAVIAALAMFGYGYKVYTDRQTINANQVVVPDLRDKPQAIAEASLVKLGLKRDVKTEASADVEKGRVIRTDPSGGTRVDKTTTTVTLYVSAGEGNVTVPPLKGQTVAEATQTLGDNKLKVGKVTEADDSELPKGQVIESTPASGESVPPGTLVALTVSSGKVTVPNVTGKSYQEATTLLAQAKLMYKTEYVETDVVPEGQVISQTPNEGTLEAGATVTIKVAQKPKPTPPPTTPAPPPTSAPPTEVPSPSPTPTPTPSDSATP